MPHILRQREIIDRRALLAELEVALADASAASFDRQALLPPLKAALERGRAEIRRRFEADGTAIRSVREQCFLVDQLIRVVYDLAAEQLYPLANPTAGQKLAIVAVGGYGRGEMAPYSDVDLLFLLPYKQTPYRAGDRVPALHAVGFGAQGRAGGPHGRRMHPLREGRPDDSHGAVGVPLRLGREGAL